MDPERTGKNVIVAAFDALKNTAQMGADVWTAATNLDTKRTAKDAGVESKTQDIEPIELEQIAPDFMAQATKIRDQAAYGSTGGDVMTQKILQFAVPFMGAMKAMGAGAQASAMANVGKVVAADAAVSFSVWDPHEGRFADLIRSIYPDAPVIGPAIDYLASDADDPALEARFKNALDSQFGSAVFSGFAFAAGKTLKGLRTGAIKAKPTQAAK